MLLPFVLTTASGGGKCDNNCPSLGDKPLAVLAAMKGVPGQNHCYVETMIIDIRSIRMVVQARQIHI